MAARSPIPTLLLPLVAAAIAGCAATPAAVREAPPDNPSPAEVRAHPERFTGREVLWGGSVAVVKNRRDHTELQVVARPLAGDGEPRRGDEAQGRFLARVAGFLDPAIYAQGRSVTLRGVVKGVVMRPVGEYDYRFPVVEAETIHLWPERVERYDYPPAWPYDPFWPHWRRPFGAPWSPYWW